MTSISQKTSFNATFRPFLVLLNDYGLEVHRFKAEWNSVISAKAD